MDTKSFLKMFFDMHCTFQFIIYLLLCLLQKENMCMVDNDVFKVVLLIIKQAVFTNKISVNLYNCKT